ncbi:MAG TPA: alpha-ketoglutarate-dependent dioxygenase AlkB [Polyangia bacterium]|nr:alpha-ketoglutarate-dependent dioxygenase AlkB [Polyangia bacterium]
MKAALSTIARSSRQTIAILSRDSTLSPPGLLYLPELITRDQERAVVEWLAASSDWREVRFRGQVARRRVLSFGARYLTQGRRLEPAPPLPPELSVLRDRMVIAACARLGPQLALAGRSRADFALCTVLRYAPGAGIGWHTDNAAFGPTVLALSLGTAARLQLRRGGDDAGAPFDLALEPRSLFVLAGEARAAWKHRLCPVQQERYSVTVRC